MENVISAVIVILIFFAIILWIVVIKPKMNRTMNQHVFSISSYQAEQKHTKEILQFVTTASIEQIRAQLKNHVPTKEEPSRIAAQLYVEQETDSFIIYALGSRLKTGLRSQLFFTPTSNGIEATYQVLTWTQMNGMTCATNEMRDLSEAIQQAFWAADADCSVQATYLAQ